MFIYDLILNEVLDLMYFKVTLIGCGWKLQSNLRSFILMIKLFARLDIIIAIVLYISEKCDLNAF